MHAVYAVVGEGRCSLMKPTLLSAVSVNEHDDENGRRALPIKYVEAFSARLA
jgi:hypothetical protein